MSYIVGIGRDDHGTPLTDEEWSAFRKSVRHAIEDIEALIVFEGVGKGLWGSSEESAQFIFDLPYTVIAQANKLDDLRTILGIIARVYGQEAIALTEGRTEFIRAAEAGVHDEAA